MTSRLACTGLALYCLVIASLGLRPYIEPLYALGHQTDLGAYNMFRAGVEADERAWLEGPGEETIPVPLSRYFWKNRLVSTTHANLNEELVDRLVDYLASRAAIRERVPPAERDRWRLVYHIELEVNGEPAVVHRERPLEGRR